MENPQINVHFASSNLQKFKKMKLIHKCQICSLSNVHSSSKSALIYSYKW